MKSSEKLMFKKCPEQSLNGHGMTLRRDSFKDC